MKDIQTLYNKIGKQVLCQRLNVKSGALRMAKSRGALPALWKDVCEELAEKKGLLKSARSKKEFKKLFRTKYTIKVEDHDLAS